MATLIPGLILGFIAAGVAFFALGWLLGGGAMLVACIAGFWTFSLVASSAGSSEEGERHNILNPVPLVYDKPLEEVFKAIRNTLAEQTVNWGDTWSVRTADTLTNTIVAHMRFEDEVQISKGVQRLKRLLVLKVQLHSVDDGKTQVEFRWTPKNIQYLLVHGLDPKACDEVITDFMRDLDTRIGAGVRVESEAIDKTTSFGIKAPDTQDLVITGVFLAFMWVNIVNTNAEAYQSKKGKLESEQTSLRDTLEKLKIEATQLTKAEQEWREYRPPDEQIAEVRRDGWQRWFAWYEKAKSILPTQ